MEVQSKDYHLYHYCDREQREVDFIAKKEDDYLYLLSIEAKAGPAVNKANFNHAQWFKENMANG